MGQGRRVRVALVLALWVAFLARGADAAIPRPGPKDSCPVCGMLVSKYPNWVAIALYRSGHAHFFDGAKDMFKYLQGLSKYAPGRRKEDLAALYVTEFYGLTKIDARKAFYVIGSDVLSPMGHELVPLETRADAEEFLKDHKGNRILAFEQVTVDIINVIENGAF